MAKIIEQIKAGRKIERFSAPRFFDGYVAYSQ